MAVSWQNFTGFLQQQIAAIQSAALVTVDASVGSVTRAWAQGVTFVALWLQGEVSQVLTITRAATSNGADLDSFMEDYFLFRPQAVTASGNVTFSRYTPSNMAIIAAGFGPNSVGAAVGALISVGPGGQQFYVAIDLNNTAYNAGYGGYVIPAGQASITVPVVALNPGVAGNLAINTLTSFVQPLVGVDTVTNAAAFVNGADAMSDADFRAMFRAYIKSLQHGTPDAIRYAINSFRAGLSVQIYENTDTSGAFRPGWFTVVVDDGTGSLTSSLVSSLQAQVNAYRAIGVTGTVISPTITTAAVSLQIAVTAGADKTIIGPIVSNAITRALNALPVGVMLPFNRLAQLAFDASPAVLNVTNISLNGGQSDLLPVQFGVIKAGVVAVG